MNLLDIQIRSERPGDEDAIDVVNCRAFGQMNEAHLVRTLRTYGPTFDCRYSLVALEADRIVGHTLFTPARIRLMGKIVDALAVAPVAVVPEKQRSGIGRQMLQYGHDLGRRDGFAFTFLLGHPEYYPKLGYRPCFGLAKIIIDTEALPEPSQKLSPRPVQLADIPWLMQCFDSEWADVDFGWQWGTALTEWTLPGTNGLIFCTQDGKRAAYALGWVGRPQWKMVLTDDPQLARDTIATIKPPTLEHHPAGWLAGNVLDSQWSKAEVEKCPAAMAYELQEGVLKPYIEALENKERLEGFCNWSLPFMIC